MPVPLRIRFIQVASLGKSARLDPIAVALGITGCAADWFLSRPWLKIMVSALPLCFVAAVGTLVVMGHRLNRDKLAARYMQLADAEVKSWENNWAPESNRQQSKPATDTKSTAATVSPSETSNEPSKGNDGSGSGKGTNQDVSIPHYAEILFRRVQQLQGSDSRSVFFVAMSYLQRGAAQQAFTLIDRIAPADRVGYCQPMCSWRSTCFRVPSQPTNYQSCCIMSSKPCDGIERQPSCWPRLPSYKGR